MRDYSKIKNESNFFQWLKTWTEHAIYWERIEPANECGFPDTTYLIKSRAILGAEGACELKYCDTNEKLSTLLRSSQTVSFLDYHKAGGVKRSVAKFVARTKEVHLYTTQAVVNAIVAKDHPSKVLSFLQADPTEVALNIRMFLEEQT